MSQVVQAEQVEKVMEGEGLNKEVLGFAVKYWLLLLFIVLFIVAYRKKQLPGPLQDITRQAVSALPQAVVSPVDGVLTGVENAVQGAPKYYY